jgi:glycosyltransferase involved in cell wall biosynthesis
MPTGYGTQTALLLPRLKAMGHDLAVSATAGQPNHPGYWQGIPVFPCTTYADVGEDVVAGHYRQFKADLVITFLCTWLLSYPAVWRDLRTIHLNPVDCDPMSWADYEVIDQTGGTPAAISEFGLRQMRAGVEGRAPLDPLYLPHGVDTKCFTPADDRAALRAEMNMTGKYVVGMNFMNNDRDRKNIDEALRGFAAFHLGNAEMGIDPHPDSVLAVHAIQALPEGICLPRLAAHLGIADAVIYSPQYEIVTGMITPPMLADWYRVLDVYLSPGNEGFGLPAVEAQACGVPVILGDWSTGPDLVGPGWLVTGQGRWNEKHRATWGRAHVSSVADKLSLAYDDDDRRPGRRADRRAAAREFALEHDINTVVREHWEPVLGELG